jgi:beta-phosphoglucomutase-like phosphatase (HAD superfamily)
VTSGAALLFDLDGTLVDSDAKHLAAFQRVFGSHGIAVDRASYERDIHGASNELIGRVFLSHLTAEQQRAVLDAKEAAYRSDVIDIGPIAGAVALLDFADRRGLIRAVVTNAPRANAEKVLSALGLELRLPIVVVGSELARPKPDPLPYVKGLELTGAVASRSIAFEDSPSGVRAAAAAGLAVVGLTTTLDAVALIRAGATMAANDFTDPRIFALIDERIQTSCSVGAGS